MHDTLCAISVKNEENKWTGEKRRIKKKKKKEWVSKDMQNEGKKSQGKEKREKKKLEEVKGYLYIHGSTGKYMTAYG